MADTIVHTIDARGNILLEIVQDYFDLNDKAIRLEIVTAVEYTAAALLARGVNYLDLRAALTPQADRYEIALFFDTSKIDQSWYGLPVHQHLLALMPKTGSHSILLGDLLGSNEQQSWIYSQLIEHLQSSGTSFQFQHSTQFYCVYINNCSSIMVQILNEGFLNFKPYVGYADVTYSSMFKTYLSGCLANGYLKHLNKIIQTHEDDLPDGTNQNTLGYSFEKMGFHCRSIPSMYYGLLLSYKIERPVLEGFEHDQVFSLNAVSSTPQNIADCIIEIDDRKIEYLNKEKAGTLKRLGVLGHSKVTLKDLIRAKLRSNYLYNLRFRPDYNVSTFNILLELEALDTGFPTRVVAAFAYEQDRNVIRLVTLY